MPNTTVRIGVPTILARALIQRIAAGFVDRITLELKNIKVRKSGTIKKIVTLGEYQLHITINRVTARLKTGKPTVTFGGNKVAMAMPVSVVSGSGRATIHFKWDGKNIAGAVCGDLDITQEVKGGVRPDHYSVSGALVLTATTEQLLAEPVFPRLTVKLKVLPAPESWAAAQKIIDDKRGICGFVLDRVDILGAVRKIIDKGFTVRIPTEKIKPLAVPVGINPSMQVREHTVALGISLSDLAITKSMIWLGSDVTVVVGDAADATGGEPPAAAAPSRPTGKPAAGTPPPATTRSTPGLRGRPVPAHSRVRGRCRASRVPPRS
jgi:hypothetical protein